MKKILFALAIMPLLIVACSSDDEKTSPTTNFDYEIKMLYGEWRITDVEVDGASINLTEPKNELYIAPTYLKFDEDGTLTGQGVLGEGTGTYGTKAKTIYTSIGNQKANLEVTSLQTATAKIKIDAKHLSQLPLINKDMEMLTVTLRRRSVRTNNFDYDIKLLYGKWRATSIEGVYDNPINLKDPVIEKIYTPTYLTFEEKGVYNSEGFMGEGIGRYVTDGKSIYTLVGNKRIEFEVTELEGETARIELHTDDINVDDEKLEAIELITVILTKQPKQK